MAGQCGWADCNAPVYRKHIHPGTLYEQDACLTHWAFLRHTDVLDTHSRQLREHKDLLTSLVASVETLVEGQQALVEGQQALVASVQTLAEGQRALIEGQNRQSRILEGHSQQLERHESLLAQLANQQHSVNGDSTA